MLTRFEKLPSFKSLIQFGASTGLNLLLLEKNFPALQKLVGYELNVGVVKYANNLFKSFKSKAVIIPNGC